MINTEKTLISLAENLYRMSEQCCKLSSIDKIIFTNAYHAFSTFRRVDAANQKLERRLQILNGAKPTIVEQIQRLWAWLLIYCFGQHEFNQSVASIRQNIDIDKIIDEDIDRVQKSQYHKHIQDLHIKDLNGLRNWNGDSKIGATIRSDLRQMVILARAQYLVKHPPVSSENQNKALDEFLGQFGSDAPKTGAAALAMNLGLTNRDLYGGLKQ